ncbi:MAG TPA: trifunctional glycosyltransferase/class I SAM-dependent methyltransferase/polysaccharide deacetylase [Thermoanaerobaculia bacterium]|nr:trifunctional glycosyltransferase/class I SAM-dependent methyltransferase/polysaccharide deacetylase [Thermoanaerobaculia bacterium]
MQSGSGGESVRTGSQPTVSVVIPCYNLGAYVNEAVQSVLDQTYGDFEIILIDDGSTDPVTRNLFTSYVRPKTRILRTENQGLARTRNLGIQEAAGKYVSCLDADDLFEPAFLERTVALLDSDPSAAFVSCWLTAFGDSSFLWNPTTCDFPHLLAEDTVCSAALMRREAVLAAGGYDPAMPAAGYEDWDLAIGMVERGLRGRIAPEYLFRYRVRAGSMTDDCTAPANHAALMEYMVEKHGAAYRQHLRGVLEVIERRTAEMEAYRREPPAPSDGEQALRIAFLEKTLRGVLESTNWKASRPLRQAASRFRTTLRSKEPGISVIVTCRDQAMEVSSAVESASRQMSAQDEIVIVDAGSTDPITAQILDGYRSAGFPVLRREEGSLPAARAAALESSRAPYLYAMGADETLPEGCLPRAREILDGDPSVAFVLFGARDADRTGFAWRPAAADLPGILACSRAAFPFVRRDAFESAGGYDATLPAVEHADWDLSIRLAAAGNRGALGDDPPVDFHVRRRPPGSDDSSMSRRVAPVFDRHRALFERHWKEAVLGQELGRRDLQAFAWDPYNTPSAGAAGDAIDWGGLRRLEPVSRVWGVDRGQPIDRWYIERFLGRRRGDIRGRVLEVKDATYTHAFGSAVERADVVDIAADNPAATLVADLAAKDALPPDAFDCFVLTQTIHIIYDVPAVLENAARSLKPGGVLLATLPCVSRLDYESGLSGDYWRFTPASARRLFERAFPDGEVEVEAHGNVLSCCGFLMGASAEDLSPGELERSDPYFPLLVCVRAVKRAAPAAGAGAGPKSRAADPGGRGLVLLYHRVADTGRDRWGLCVSPENFREHVELLSRGFQPLSLRELAEGVRDGHVPDRGVAVTFDDGYRDNLTAALPALETGRIPATFFISGDGAAFDGTFWWEALDAAMERVGLDGEAARELHARLMRIGPEERKRVLEDLAPPTGDLPPRLTPAELAALAAEPLAEVGAHGWSHRVLGDLPADDQKSEIATNVEQLLRTTGVAVRSFAYPFGGPFDRETVAILREVGIDVACALGSGTVTARSDPFALPRVEVGDWNGRELEARLNALLDG